MSPRSRPCPGEWPAWLRRVGTATNFALFGVGGLFVTGVAFTVLRLAVRDPEARRRRAQLLIHRCFRLFTGTLKGLHSITLDFPDRDRLYAPGGRLVIANHPSLIDVVLLVAALPQADCVVKRANWSNPFMGGALRAAGYIPNDGGEDLVERCVARLKEGRTLVLFPEGTRSPPGALGPFKRGAARIALASGCDVVEVAIRCEPPLLHHGIPWHYVPPDGPAHYTLEVAQPAPARADIHGEELPPSVAVRRVTAAWTERFAKRLGYVRS